ncbi:leucine-rich repeat protein kinase family protein [Actinidia rufa]|uniref:Leucine-rich repeat protein kinase family protein n=1 Tax=Actinidia rufa TaxID=165716 RepID=A0A7J0H780_9ERIC|nr:leucine-rich repeat protein kinase family protein [Actinidia rufa]
MLDLSDNLISGELSDLVGGLSSLELLNLSNNALVGKIPENLTTLHNLTVLSLKSNYFSGSLPSELNSVEILDLSSNLINGSLPSNFSGDNLRYFNASYNRLSGEITSEFANQIPTNVTIDLSFNNFTGEIPETSLFLNQAAESYSGNPELCGKPLKNLCPIPSTISTPANASAPTSPPAIAAIPKTIESTPATTSPGKQTGSNRNGLKPRTIVGIVVGDIVGVSIVALIFIYVYQLKKRKSNAQKTRAVKSTESKEYDWSSSEESKGIRGLACLRKQANNDEESSETTNSDCEEIENGQKGHDNGEKWGPHRAIYHGSPIPSAMGCISPYYAPESLRSLKPNPRWDVYSFGVVLLELITGKVIVSDELGLGPGGLAGEENNRALRMADAAIRPDLEGKEEALLGLFRLGHNCISGVPQKRPSMKEVQQALEKFPIFFFFINIILLWSRIIDKMDPIVEE